MKLSLPLQGYFDLLKHSPGEKKFVCIHCGRPVSGLYRQISSTVLKIIDCDKCKKPADKYIEFEVLIILIDLILLSKPAYRHILYNSDCKNLWKIGCILILLEAYCFWTDAFRGITSITYRSHLTDPFLSEKGFYLSTVHFVAGFLLLYGFIYLFTRVLHRSVPKVTGNGKTYPHMLLHGVILASIGKFLFIPIIIWRENSTETGMAIHIVLVLMYFVISLVQIHSVVSDCTRSRSGVIVILAFIVKAYFLTRVSGLLQQFV
ncbi:protein ARV1 [Anopheles arabiensis]|uniref:Protein ARV n=1 Tax=Anopheles arabiensis TaxID=7173 RepID=A0A182HZC1_ANOAR|nr:protein ARV1 [Anopheles arabiensis]